MAKNMTEDSVRDEAREILGLKDSEIAKAGVGQLTTFNQLGFAGVAVAASWSSGSCRLGNISCAAFWNDS